MNENNRKEIGRRVRNKMELLAKSGRPAGGSACGYTPPVKADQGRSKSMNRRRRQFAGFLNGALPVGAANELRRS
jgi:DNA invertase Pin-like site-specific DNA recombinase